MIQIPINTEKLKGQNLKKGDRFFCGFDLDQYQILDFSKLPNVSLKIKGSSQKTCKCLAASVASYETETMTGQFRNPSIHQGPIKYAFDKEIDVTWNELTRSGPGFERFLGVFFEVLDDCFIEEIKASFFIDDLE